VSGRDPPAASTGQPREVGWNRPPVPSTVSSPAVVPRPWWTAPAQATASHRGRADPCGHPRGRPAARLGPVEPDPRSTGSQGRGEQERGIRPRPLQAAAAAADHRRSTRSLRARGRATTPHVARPPSPTPANRGHTRTPERLSETPVLAGEGPHCDRRLALHREARARSSDGADPQAPGRSASWLRLRFGPQQGACVRIATWNLERPARGSWKRLPRQLARMDAIDAGIWVLTETRASVSPAESYYGLHTPCSCVEAHAAVLEVGRLDRCPVTEPCFHAGEELGETEWVGQVVIRPALRLRT
jgi:hypothetical protein